MPRSHLVRFGAMGSIGRFAAVDAVRYPRRSRVIVRTARGLETGEVLSPPEEDASPAADDGPILRGMTVEDDLLAARLERHRNAAFEACRSRILDRGLVTVLMDVEHLFDGRTVVFYFLGEIGPELDSLLDELAEIYDANVQFRSFADTLTHGCGPGCGTEEAAGGGCKRCVTTCAVAAACPSRRA